jgi:hypothetical protein
VDLSRSIGAIVPLGCNPRQSRGFGVQIRNADSEPLAISAPIRKGGGVLVEVGRCGVEHKTVGIEIPTSH